MMNKKGGHVDWAISIGIFLVYLIGMFILLRPGITPVYKPDSLLKIIEDQFMNNITWEVKEIPIILDRDCGGSSLWDECAEGNVERPRIFIDVEEGWNLGSEIEPKDKAKLDGSVLTDLKDKIIPKGTYFIKLSPESKGIKELKISISGASPCQCHIDEQRKVHASLGASTFKEGINNNWLSKLKIDYPPENYGDDYKKAFGFPTENDFQILEGTNVILGSKEEPYAQANVFAKQIKTWYLDKDGKLDPSVEIVIRVW